jgi:TIR domain
VSTPEPKIFISYRRGDAAGHAGRLYDAMAAQFEGRNVFMDVDMAPGVDFVDRITKAVGACHVLLVIMGPRWATILDEEGNLRIAEREDFVRLEVETALQRPEVTVIPVLVAGAQVPEPDALPEGLRPLSRRHALELSDTRWHYDVQRLLDRLQQLLPGTVAPKVQSEPPTPPPTPPATALPAASAPAEPLVRVRPWYQLLLEGVLVAVVSAIVANWIVDAIKTERGSEDLSKIVHDVVWRGATFALVGAALAVWLTLVRGERRSLARRAFAGLLIGALAGGLEAAAYQVPTTLIDDLTEEHKQLTHLISDTSYALEGGVLGAMIGALWIPRRLGVGLASGAVAGFVQHAIWLNRHWEDATFSVAFQSCLIVGAVLGVLIALDALSASRSKAAGPGTPAAGFG